MGLLTLLLPLGLGCGGGQPPPAADLGRLRGALGMEVLARAPLQPVLGDAVPYDGYTVRPVSLQVLRGFRVSAALWLPEGPGPHPAVLVAHGHFGEGKSAGESQGPAHAFAQAGWAALAVDTPGVEEGERPDRQLHFEGGAHNRALLAAAGSSALALQLAGLQAGLDYLQARGDIGPVAVTGASGGAVQALYLALIDPRPVGAVLASYVPTPREPRAGGCACDGLPGWPGPDPALLAGLRVPTLWLSELEQDPPPGLPRSADFAVVPGPHGYGAELVAEALRWLGDLLGRPRPAPGPTPYTAPERLRSADVGPAGLASLLSPSNAPRWTPALRAELPYTVRCAGEGPRVITAGAGLEDEAALRAAGLSPCTLTLHPDELAVDEAIIRGRSPADRPASALALAVRQQRALGVYAARAWGVAAEGAGVPYVLRGALTAPEQVDPALDPPWVHAPGWWWPAPRYPGALAVGEDPAALAAALARSGGG